MQENWQVHQEALDTAKERVIGYSCLDAELLGADAEKCDWANTEFIGYSWFKGDQFAATKDLPFFDAMATRPPEIIFIGKKAVDDACCRQDATATPTYPLAAVFVDVCKTSAGNYHALAATSGGRRAWRGRSRGGYCGVWGRTHGEPEGTGA